MLATALTAALLTLPVSEADWETVRLEAAIHRYLTVNTGIKQALQEFRDAGGGTAKALPIYLRMLRADPRPPLDREIWILGIASGIEGDRDAFRPFALALLDDKRVAVVQDGVRALGKFGAAEDAPRVAELLHAGAGPKEMGFYYQIVETLRVIGTEKELAEFDKARKASLLSDRPEFWKKVDECEKAIRDRAADQKAKKEKELKAMPADKK